MSHKTSLVLLLVRSRRRELHKFEVHGQVFKALLLEELRASLQQAHEDLSGRLVDRSAGAANSKTAMHGDGGASGGSVPSVQLQVTSVQKQSALHHLQFQFTPDERYLYFAFVTLL